MPLIPFYGVRKLRAGEVPRVSPETLLGEMSQGLNSISVGPLSQQHTGFRLSNQRIRTRELGRRGRHRSPGSEALQGRDCLVCRSPP